MTRRKDPRTTRRPAHPGELPAVTPVPRRGERHYGWTPERQRAFIEALADLGSVGAAARAVDMSSVGAYHLRRQPGTEAFRAAWEAALALGIQRIEDVAMDRALNGTEEPVYSYGKLVGTRIKHNDRLLMFMLRNRAPERFAAGGGPRGLNALDKQQLEKLHKQWEAEYLSKQRNVSIAEVQASIERKVEEAFRQVAPRRAARWAALTEETRTAWAHFIALRKRDLDAMNADAETRKLLDAEWDSRADRFEAPEVPALPAPRKTAEEEQPQHPPAGWSYGKPKEPEPPKTVWTL
ncbi:MAG: hypothetical protein ACKO01_04885, partial [Erythrobacter sp.]